MKLRLDEQEFQRIGQLIKLSEPLRACYRIALQARTRNSVHGAKYIFYTSRRPAIPEETWGRGAVDVQIRIRPTPGEKECKNFARDRHFRGN